MQALFEVPAGLEAELAPHLLSQRFLLDDLSVVTDEALERRALSGFADLTLRALSRARRLGPDALVAEFEGWVRLARAVARAPTGLQKLGALLQYLAMVTEVGEPALTEFARAIEAPQEERTMPTLVEKWLAEGHEKGLEKGLRRGRADLLLRLLRLKFTDVPAEVVERVETASSEQIEGWSEALLTACSLGAVFGD